MNESYTQRFLELQLGDIVDHGLHPVDGFINGEGGVVVVFEVDKQYGADVLGDDEIDGVLPVDIEAQTVVVATLSVVVECVEQRCIGDVFPDGLTVQYMSRT